MWEDAEWDESFWEINFPRIHARLRRYNHAKNALAALGNLARRPETFSASSRPPRNADSWYHDIHSSHLDYPDTRVSPSDLPLIFAFWVPQHLNFEFLRLSPHSLTIQQDGLTTLLSPLHLVLCNFPTIPLKCATPTTSEAT